MVAAIGGGRLDTACGGCLARRPGSPNPTPRRHRCPDGYPAGTSPAAAQGEARSSGSARAARETVVASQEEARSLRHGYVGTEHLLLGLLRQDSGVAARALRAAGVNAEAARQQVLDIIGRGHAAAPRAHPVHPAGQEGAAAGGPRGPPARPPVHRHRASAARPAPRGPRVWPARCCPGSARTRTRSGSTWPGCPASRRSPATPVRRRPASGTTTCASPRPGRTRTRRWTRATPRRPAAARGTEKQLIAERDQLIAEWSANADVAALGREVDRLGDEVRRLQDLLLRHGIEPEESTEQSA